MRKFASYLGKTGAEIVYSKLLENNVKNAFIYSGGAIMPVIDQFNKKNINYFINTNEQCLGFCAGGYSRADSSNVGVGICTSGPGLTNLVTAITDANNDSFPMVIFSGNVSTLTRDTSAFQECPSVDITKPITK